jgi:hypothetical protein
MKTTPSIFNAGAIETRAEVPLLRRWLLIPECSWRLSIGGLSIFLAFLAMSFTTMAGESYAQRLGRLQAELKNSPTNQNLLFKLGDLCHDEATNDNREATKLAEKYFLQLLALDPQNARARVLYGSTLTMKARDAFWPTTQMSYVNAGIKEMDAAVNLAPDDPVVRLARAVNNVHMPKFLGREEIVRADYAWLWEKVASQPDRFTAAERQTVSLHQGRFLWEQKKLADARKVWQQGIAQAPNSPLARDIQDRLRKAEAH